MEKFKDIMVNRVGISANSYLKTTEIIKEILPKKNYQIIKNNLIETDKKETFKNPKLIIPKFTRLFGNWNYQKILINPKENNILGESVVFESSFDELSIPIEIATPEKLKYYDCFLYQQDEIITFETQESLPLTMISIGKDYLKDFILQKNYGNGFYLEYHDNPHFHMPINLTSEGYLILAKRINQIEYHLTAFKIPLGSGVYLSPFVLHNDCCLIGEYLVVYTKSKEFSTANLFYQNDLVKIKFT